MWYVSGLWPFIANKSSRKCKHFAALTVRSPIWRYSTKLSLNPMIQFYLNNVTIFHQLTLHSATSWPTTRRLYRDHRLRWRHFTLCIRVPGTRNRLIYFRLQHLLGPPSAEGRCILLSVMRSPQTGKIYRGTNPRQLFRLQKTTHGDVGGGRQVCSPDHSGRAPRRPDPVPSTGFLGQ